MPSPERCGPRRCKASDGFRPDLVEIARSVLPDQLAVAFRGVLSFWTQRGEFSDTELAPRPAPAQRL